MAETINHTWQTVEQAAVTLNVSTRTVARRLANGSLESRVDENGRRLVLIQQIGPAGEGESAADMAADSADNANALAASSTSASQAVAGAVSVAGGSNSQAIAMLNVLQTTVTIAREDAVAARRTAKFAWGGVAFMAVAIVAASVFVSSSLTRSWVTNEMLQGQLAENKKDLSQTQAELMATRSEAAVAKNDLKTVRGELDQQKKQSEAAIVASKTAAAEVAAAQVAMKPTITGIANGPATQPAKADAKSSIFNRIVSVFGE